MIHQRSLPLLHAFAELETVLVLCGAIIPTGIPGDHRNPREEDSEDESEDERQRSNFGSRGAQRPMAKAKGGDDSGSELDI